MSDTRIITLHDGIYASAYVVSSGINVKGYKDIAFVASGSALVTNSSATFHVEVSHNPASTHNWVWYNLLVSNIAGGSSVGGESDASGILRHFASTSIASATTVFMPMDSRFLAPYVRMCANVAGGTGTVPGLYYGYLIASR